MVKTKRCSSQGEEAADALSKGDWERAWVNMPHKETDPKRIPRVLLRWIENPYPDLELGQKILKELSRTTKVLYD